MTNIIEFIPKELYELASIFGNKSPLYIVGGFIRDCIEFNEGSSDIDLAANKTPQEVIELLKHTKFKVFEASIRLGTLIIKGERTYEYTTFRKDSYPNGSGVHAPQEITFTKSLDIDARRRDFKCNAIYFELLTNKIIDPLNGVEDIENKVLSTTINPYEVLSQDGLRILRLARMKSNLGYNIEKNTKEAANALVGRLEDISVERIQTEIKKILAGKYVYDALCFLRDINAFKIIIPELEESRDFPQPVKYHKYDVLEHVFKTIEVAPVRVRLAALFHDIAKPLCQKRDNNMHKHAEEGVKISHEVLKRLKFSNEDIKLVLELVGAHMFDLNDTAKVYTIRKFIVKHYKYIEEIIELQIADAIATGLISGPLRESKTREQLIIMRERKIPFSIQELTINGNDVKEVGFKNKEIGKILQEVFDVCLTENVKNNREDLLNYINKKWRKIYGNHCNNL